MSEILLSEPVIAAIGGILVTIIGWLAKLANDYVKAEVENKTLQRILTEVTEVTANVTKSVSQQTVKELKRKSKDGSLSDEEKEEIKNSAINKLKSQMRDETLERLQEVTDDVDEYLSDKIEAIIHDTKSE